MKKNKAAALAAVALAGTFVLSGCTAKATDTLINIDNGKTKITYGYGNFVAKYNQATYDQYYLQYMGQNYWSKEQSGKTMEETVKDNVIDGIEEQYVDKLHAGDYDVKLTSSDKKKIQEAAKKFMSSNTDKAIEQMGATQDYAEDLLEYETYQARVRQAVEDKAEVTVTDDEANQSTVSYVYFSTASSTDASGNAQEKTDDEKKALKKQAENVANASDFDKAAKAEGAKVETHSYTTKGKSSDDTVLGETVIDAAKKLTKEGQISGVITVKDKGYYVLRMDKLLDKDATKTQRETLTSQKKEEEYNKLVKQWKKKVNFDLNEKLWKQVKFTDLFTAKTQNASGDATSSN
jgi:foldase protein PrsA